MPLARIALSAAVQSARRTGEVVLTHVFPRPRRAALAPPGPAYRVLEFGGSGMSRPG